MRVRTLPATILFALLLLLSAAAYPEPVGFVNDFAEVLSTSQREKLESRLRAYEKATTVEVAVAIVPSLEGETLEDYARGLFRAWGIGKADKNNGVLILVAHQERRVRIQTGYGVESELTNDEAAAILREVMVPRVRARDFAGGVIAGADAVLDALNLFEEPAELVVHVTVQGDSTIVDSSSIDGVRFVDTAVTAAMDRTLDSAMAAAAPPALYEPPAPVEEGSSAPERPVDPAVDGEGFNWLALLYAGAVVVALVVVAGIVSDRRRKAALRLELANTLIPRRRARANEAWTRLGDTVAAAREHLLLEADQRRLDEVGDQAPGWLDEDEAEIAQAEALAERDPDGAAKLLEKAEGTEKMDAALRVIDGRVKAYRAAAEAAPATILAGEMALSAAERARQGARGEGYRDRPDDDLALSVARQELQTAREFLAAYPPNPERAMLLGKRVAASAGEVTEGVAAAARLRASTDAEIPALEREHATLGREMAEAARVMKQLRSGYPERVWGEPGRRFAGAEQDHARAAESLGAARRANSMEAQEFERAAKLVENARAGLGRVAEVVPHPAACLSAQRAAEAALPALLAEADRSRASARKECAGSDVGSVTTSRLARAESTHANAGKLAGASLREPVAIRDLLKDVTLEYHAVSDQAREDRRAAAEKRRIELERREAERRREEERRRVEAQRRDEERRAEKRRQEEASREESSSRTVSYYSSGSSSSSSSSSYFGGGSSGGGGSSSSDDSSSSSSSSPFGGGDSGSGGASDD